MNRVYEGKRVEDGTLQVTVDGQPLNPRFDLRNHSPTGFEISYHGSGPAQTSLALLADALGDELALRHYQRYKREVVAGMEKDHFLVTQAEIRFWLHKVLTSPDER